MGGSFFSHTAYQPQQVFLSADTLYNNICMFRDCDKEKPDEPFAHLDSGNIHEIEKGLLAMLPDMMRCGTLKIKV